MRSQFVFAKKDTSIFILIGKIVLRVYRKLPLSHEQRVRIKEVLFQHFGVLFRRVPQYERWLNSRIVSEAVFRNANERCGPKRVPSKILWIINHWDLQTQKYRVFNYVDELSKHGIRSEVLYDDAYDPSRTIDCDLIVLSRIAASDPMRRLVIKAKSLRIPIIYDIDDLVFHPER